MTGYRVKMGKNTGIEWTEATWNPWYGCQRVSPGAYILFGRWTGALNQDDLIELDRLVLAACHGKELGKAQE